MLFTRPLFLKPGSIDQPCSQLLSNNLLSYLNKRLCQFADHSLCQQHLPSLVLLIISIRLLAIPQIPRSFVLSVASTVSASATSSLSFTVGLLSHISVPLWTMMLTNAIHLYIPVPHLAPSFDFFSPLSPHCASRLHHNGLPPSLHFINNITALFHHRLYTHIRNIKTFPAPFLCSTQLCMRSFGHA